MNLIQKKYEASLDALRKILDSRISKEKAYAMVNKYRAANPTSVKSIWLDHEIIDLIQRKGATFTGIRVYLGSDDNKPMTFILSPTYDNGDGRRSEMDYFDYGDPCLPGESCDMGNP